METVTRRCNACHIDQPLENFHRAANRPLGHCYTCKVCTLAYRKTPVGREQARQAQTRYWENLPPEQREARRLSMKAYRQSAAGRAAKKRYRERFKATASQEQREQKQRQIQRYGASTAGRAANKRFFASDRGKEVRKRVQKTYKAKHPEKMAAKSALRSAIVRGVIVRPKVCGGCWGTPTEPLHGHHHLGYDAAHRLDVVWLCRKCHRAAHRAA